MEMFFGVPPQGCDEGGAQANALGAGSRFAPLRSPGWEGESGTSAKLPKGRPHG